MYEEFNISSKIIEASGRATDNIQNQFINIQKTAEKNQLKVLFAMQRNRVSDAHFSGTSGYGYNDTGRETIEKIFAEVLGVEDALVRMQFVSGTHAITSTLFGILRPGDELLSISGAPYDTLHDAISGENIGSLRDFGVRYNEIELNSNYEIDTDKVCEYLRNNEVKMIMIQRSKGYGWRKSFSSEYINSVIEKIHKDFPHVICFTDNCYGELVDDIEPFKSDLLAGSLIKNLGGGIAPTGAYVAGKAKYVELVANRLTSPGIGKECGATLGFNKQVLQGIFMAPHIVGEALKTAIFCAALTEELGFIAEPLSSEIRHDIIQSVKIGDEKKLINFCQGLQSVSPIDSHVTPYPWDMPGYADKVIMAAGTFNQGASIELSADAPIKEPYIVYLQGGLTFESGKIGVMKAAEGLL